MWHQVGTAQAMDRELRALQGTQQRLLDAGEEIQALEGVFAFVLGLGQAIERPQSGTVIVKGGEKLEVAPVAARVGRIGMRRM